eukprot:5032001-Ditylum_brightwellii.AAC.1
MIVHVLGRSAPPPLTLPLSWLHYLYAHQFHSDYSAQTPLDHSSWRKLWLDQHIYCWALSDNLIKL